MFSYMFSCRRNTVLLQKRVLSRCHWNVTTSKFLVIFLFALSHLSDDDVLCVCRSDQTSDPSTVNITDEMSKGSFGNVWKTSVNPEATKKENEPGTKRYSFKNNKHSYYAT